MGARIYVGGLPYATDETRLSELFAPHGTIASVRIITDKMTGRSRGFGFVEMSTDEEAAAAIAALNGTELDGRSLTVNEARPQQSSGFGGGPSRRPSGGGRGGRSGNSRGRW
jgi:RNA recognition motif-containing protein